jgi:hypothetical protein
VLRAIGPVVTRARRAGLTTVPRPAGPAWA